MRPGDSQMKILLVDDFSTMRRVVKTLLRQSGYNNFIEADTLAKARAALEENPDVACVVANWTLQEGSGIDFLRSVRGDPRFAQLPFLLVTAEQDKDSTLEAIKGIKRAAFIVKPFTGHALNERLQKAFENKQTAKRAG